MVSREEENSGIARGWEGRGKLAITLPLGERMEYN